MAALILALEKGHLEVGKKLIEARSNIYLRRKGNKKALMIISNMLKFSKDKSEKGKYIEIAYIIIRKMAEDYIQHIPFIL